MENQYYPGDAATPNADELAGLERDLAEKRLALARLASGSLEHARRQMDIAEILLAMTRKAEAWELARAAFQVGMAHASWQDAVEACNLLYQSEQAESIPALGMGVWLAVTFPVTPHLSYAMLAHVVEETADQSDGAALAAIAARYVIDLRASDAEHESLSFIANNLIARVAERHGQVRDQAALDDWMGRLALRDPAVFLPRLGKVVNAIVGDTWWFDRDELRRQLPD